MQYKSRKVFVFSTEQEKHIMKASILLCLIAASALLAEVIFFFVFFRFFLFYFAFKLNIFLLLKRQKKKFHWFTNELIFFIFRPTFQKHHWVLDLEVSNAFLRFCSFVLFFHFSKKIKLFLWVARCKSYTFWIWNLIKT